MIIQQPVPAEVIQNAARDQILVQNLQMHARDNSSQDTKRRSSIKTSAVDAQFDEMSNAARTSKS